MGKADRLCRLPALRARVVAPTSGAGLVRARIAWNPVGKGFLGEALEQREGGCLPLDGFGTEIYARIVMLLRGFYTNVFRKAAAQ